MMLARIITIIAVLCLGLVSIAGPALGAPTKKKADVEEHQDCVWQGGGWVCEDIVEDEGAHNPSNKGNKWTQETDTDTTYKGNSKNVRDETTINCIYNPGGKLSKSSDPECFN